MSWLQLLSSVSSCLSSCSDSLGLKLQLEAQANRRCDFVVKELHWRGSSCADHNVLDLYLGLAAASNIAAVRFRASVYAVP